MNDLPLIVAAVGVAPLFIVARFFPKKNQSLYLSAVLLAGLIAMTSVGVFTAQMRHYNKVAYVGIDVIWVAGLVFVAYAAATIFKPDLKQRKVQVFVGILAVALGFLHAIALRHSEAWPDQFFSAAKALGAIP